MITFHGTQTENLDSILKVGLRPDPSGWVFESRDIDPVEASDWQEALTGKEFAKFVFLSTRPVAGKGGDPVSFAGPWRWRSSSMWNPAKPGCIVVVDCPRELVRKALTNQDLDRLHEKAYIHRSVDARSLLWIWHYLKTNRLEPTRKLCAEQLELVKVHASEQWVDPGMSAEGWREFSYAYRDLMNNPRQSKLAERRQELFRKHALSIPTDPDGYDAPYNWDSPSHVVDLCGYAFRFRGVAESGNYENVPHHFWSSPADALFERLIIDNLPFLVNAATGYFEPHSFEEMDGYLKRHGTWPKEGLGSRPWLEKFPPLMERLPPTWRPDFGKVVNEDVFRQDDTQLLCASIPAEHILGAIKIWDGRKFLPHVRPNRRRGVTLESRLWQLTQQIRRSYTGRPVVIEE